MQRVQTNLNSNIGAAVEPRSIARRDIKWKTKVAFSMSCHEGGNLLEVIEGRRGILGGKKNGSWRSTHKHQRFRLGLEVLK